MFNWNAASKHLERSADADEGKDLIMVVDDEATNRSLLSGILSDKYRVLVAEDGEDALSKVTTQGITTIVCDHRMPGMTGLEFFTELEKQHHRATRIVLTGYAELQSVISAINQAGIFRYLTKPVETELLWATVEEAVHHFKIRSENNRLIALVKDLLEEKAELVKELRVEGIEPKQRKANTLDIVDPKKVELAVMFVDIRGFTRFSAATPASEVIRTLQTIFTRIHQIIYDSGGMVDKHLGDGLMAVFGLGGGLDGNLGATAGIEAARCIVEAFPGVLQSLGGGEYESLKLSVGLAAGQVVLGMIGTERRAELAIIGQPANLAARLQEFTKVALTSDAGREVLGEFAHSMALLEPNLVDGMGSFKRVCLNGLKVRDFESLDELAVISL